MAQPAAQANTNCVLYATDYANRYAGSGDPVGDAVQGGMAGAVIGGAWRGPGGAVKGARAGAALATLDNLGSMPGGWQGLYDMAFQMCQQQTSPVNADTLYPVPPVALPQPACRSSASVDKRPLRAPDGSISAGSGTTGCP
ncbi:hypothetical protein E1297_23525 [Roseibium sp. RKSG952]|nr:hypothetical protein [Roseibium sp. RKSG952]